MESFRLTPTGVQLHSFNNDKYIGLKISLEISAKCIDTSFFVRFCTVTMQVLRLQIITLDVC